MRDLVAVRLYFPASARASRSRFWHHLSAPVLAHHLLKVARQAGIEQAILHHVDAGYLKGQRLSHHHPEASAMGHPQCLELVDSRDILDRFLTDHVAELQKVRVLMLSCETPELATTLD
jgi:PII-like signaling protein